MLSFEHNSESKMLKERLDEVKHKLLERVKETDVRKKQRRASVSSVGSLVSQGKKRQHSGETDSGRMSTKRRSSALSATQ